LQAAITASIGARGSAGDDPDSGKLFQVFKQDHLYTLAGHTSHSSHSSHASHASHRSGSGGSYPVYSPPAYTPVYTPQPVYTPPTNSLPTTAPSPNSSQLTASPPKRDPQPLSGRTELFTSIVRRVQLGLLAYGYYDGPINGVVGSKMKESIKQFQSAFHMKETGTITPEVLDALKISAE
jgi:His-Xaa-Ser repeat protein HxsA